VGGEAVLVLFKIRKIVLDTETGSAYAVASDVPVQAEVKPLSRDVPPCGPVRREACATVRRKGITGIVFLSSAPPGLYADKEGNVVLLTNDVCRLGYGKYFARDAGVLLWSFAGGAEVCFGEELEMFKL